MLLFYLQYNKGAGGSRQGQLPGGGGDRGDFGQGVVLTQNQRFAVAEHRAGAQGLGGELVDLGVLGQADSGGVGLAVVDDKVGSAGLAVGTGMCKDMRTLADGLGGVIDSAAHDAVPQQSGKIVGARVKDRVAQVAVIAGRQRVVEDDAIGDGCKAAQLVQRAENILISRGPGSAAAARVTGLSFTNCAMTILLLFYFWLHCSTGRPLPIRIFLWTMRVILRKVGGAGFLRMRKEER